MKHLFTLLALFSFSLFAQTVPNYVPTNGLVGWWPFNGNANDESGNGNNGNVTSATLTSDRFGIPNHAFNFDGLDDEINLGVNPSFGVTSIQRITVSIWFQSVNNSEGMLFSKYTNLSPSNSSYFVQYGTSSNGKLTISGNGSNSVVSNNLGLAPQNWIHGTFIFKNNKAAIYINGNFIDSISLNMNNSVPNVPFLVGRVSGSFPGYFNGVIDDIGIWNRALNSNEIQNLFYSCTDTIATQPTNINAVLGNNATFTTGTSAISATYQWQGQSGGSFVNLSNSGQFSGVTTGTLTVSNITGANNGLEFRCIVDHGNCVDTSDVALLTACFDVTNQPFDRYVVAGTSTNFGLTTNDPSNCTYQWQTNAGFGYQNLSNAGQYSGTTSSTLAVANVSSANNNQSFRCIVTAGTCKDTTSEARIILSGVGVSENSLQRISVSPNPTRGSVDLGVSLEGNYTLIGIDGRAVQTGALRQILDISNQPAGVYSLRLETPAGSRVVKVVKE
jgi:hypothetical protein